MKLKEIISQSFKYPLSNVKRLLILGILIAFSILIIPGILAFGYFIRIIDSSFKDSHKLPPFNEWKKMFTDGLKYIMVILVYLGVPAFIAVLLGVFIAIISYSTINLITFTLIWTILIGLILIVPYFLSFMGVARMVKEERLGAAFEFGKVISIIKNIGSGRYISAIVIMTILSLVYSGVLDIAKFYHLDASSIYVLILVAYLIAGSYLIIFEGKLTAMLYQEGIKEQIAEK